MRRYEGETMTMSGGVVVHALCEGNDVTGFYDHSIVTQSPPSRCVYLPMLRHSTWHRLRQVMKPNRKPVSLQQSGGRNGAVSFGRRNIATPYFLVKHKSTNNTACSFSSFGASLGRQATMKRMVEDDTLYPLSSHERRSACIF